MYAMTNDGYLHAIDIEDGSEVFSFVPKQLLANFSTLYENIGGPHNYGLDGGIEVKTLDHNGNGQTETPDAKGNNDHVYIYFGQRRGGRNYFAMDITDRSNPKMLWTIEGGQTDSAFEELGQSWSEPQHHRIQVKSGGALVAKDVIIFGGGYDPQQDVVSTRTADGQGRAVYIVDALSGALLWWAGGVDREGPGVVANPAPDLVIPGMDYSIPSTVRVLDTNTDGFADRMYVGDMGGQIFRIDIDNLTVDTISKRITGGVIADLQKTNAAAIPGAVDNRRFYSPPDVALIPGPDGKDYLNLAIGSGYRAHPLESVTEDRFYALQDFAIFAPPQAGSPPVTTYTAINESDLDDRTNLNVVSSKPNGWYIKLTDLTSGAFAGEKVLAESLTFDGKILFTTFTPVAAASSTACSPSQGAARLYVVDVTNAAPTENFDTVTDPKDGSKTRSDRAYNLVRSGIPPEVTVLFPGLDADTKPVTLVGAEKLNLDLSQRPIKTYWFQK